MTTDTLLPSPSLLPLLFIFQNERPMRNRNTSKYILFPCQLVLILFPWRGGNGLQRTAAPKSEQEGEEKHCIKVLFELLRINKRIQWETNRDIITTT